MFSKTLLVAITSSAVLAVAIPTGSNGQCDTGSAQCCNTVESASSPSAAALLAVLGVVVQGVDALVGLGCTSVVGGSCDQTAVCCTDNRFQGLINIGCSPISL